MCDWRTVLEMRSYRIFGLDSGTRMTVELLLSHIRSTTVTPWGKTLESPIRDRTYFERYHRIVRNET